MVWVRHDGRGLRERAGFEMFGYAEWPGLPDA
jgi:hypothetical protein